MQPTFKQQMSVVDDIVAKFVRMPDKNNEYTLRFANDDNTETFVRRIMELFPTNQINITFNRKDDEVKSAFANPVHVTRWRHQYGHMPRDTFTIIERWIRVQLATGTSESLAAASTIVFATRSTASIPPIISRWNGVWFACWLSTEKTSDNVRLVPLFFSIGRGQYERLAAAAPTATAWNTYSEVDVLLDQLHIPRFARKGNLPRQILIGLVERIESDTTLLKPLMALLPRGRLDLFNLLLGHRSKSYTAWTYMACLISETDEPLALPVQRLNKRPLVDF